jgi:predicted nucleic acid-binding protein
LKERVPAVTSTFIVDETVTLLQRRAGHRAALIFAERALGHAILPVLEVNDSLLLDALARFRRSPGLEFSFTDCTTFCIMDREGIQRAFAFDEDFHTAGFTLI